MKEKEEQQRQDVVLDGGRFLLLHFFLLNVSFMGLAYSLDGMVLEQLQPTLTPLGDDGTIDVDFCRPQTHSLFYTICTTHPSSQ